MLKILKILPLIFSLTFFVAGCTEETKEEIKKTPKITFITDRFHGNDSFLMQAYNAYLHSAEQYNFEVNHIEVASIVQWIEMTKLAIDQGADIIIGLGWQAAEAFSTIELLYPDIKFVVIDSVAQSDHIKNYIYEVTHGAYILGVMVAHAFPNEEYYGYIGNYQNQSNYEYRYGFVEGVKSVNPNAKFLIDFANSYADTETVYQLAKKQSELGVRFIMGSISSHANSGIFRLALEKAGTENPIYTSGLSIDQSTSENPYILGGLLKNTNIPVTKVLQDLFEKNEFIAGIETLTLGDGFGVLYITKAEENANFINKDILTDEVIEKTREVYLKILNNELVIIPDQNF